MGDSAGSTLTTGSSNIYVGNSGNGSGESTTIRIGRTQTATFVAGISGATVPSGVAVIIDSSGHLGTTTSSARLKEAVTPMAGASEAIYALDPVIFHYNHELDPNGVPQFGLVAEEVEKVNPALVARGDDGKPYTVRYEAVNAMLLNEFLKAHRKIEEQDASIADLKSTVAQQQKEMRASQGAAQAQQVNARVEMHKAAPHLIINDH